MIADTDFLLALVKPQDWLKPAAEAVLRRHRQDLRATEANLLELLLVAHRYRLQPLDLVAQVHQLVPFEDESLALMAADNMHVHGLSPFDAVLAAHAERGSEPIVSSDSTFDVLGLERVPLR